MDSREANLALAAAGIAGVVGLSYYIYTKINPQTSQPRPTVKLPPNKLQKSDDGAPMATPMPLCKILFGSQTGTAEMFAKTLAKEGKKVGFRTQVIDLLDYEPDDLMRETFVIFVVATYGEGEPTDTAREFYNWFLAQEAEVCDLSQLKYTIFGLGDTQYKHFNQCAKDTETHLQKLGAKCIYERGEGDADKSIEEDFDNWKNDMWPVVALEFGLHYAPSDADTFAVERNMKLVFSDSTATAAAPAPFLPFPKTSYRAAGPKTPFYATVVVNKELLNDPTRSTRHIELSIEGSTITYEAGDHLGVLPRNSSAVVDTYLKTIQCENPSTPFAMVNIKGSNANQLPTRCTFQQALEWYIDLTGVPKKEVLKAFVSCVTDEQQKEEFMGLLRSNPDSKEKYKKLVEKLRDTFGFLRKFNSCKVPVDLFMEIMPRLQPRFYSIASDSRQTPKTIHVCAAVVENGVCTNYLKDLKVGDLVPIYVRKSTFHPPRNLKTPFIMIGPGTGIAPFVGFLWRLVALKEKGETLPDCHLFFGCRKRSEDYLYQELLERCHQQGILTNLFLAFSREQAQKVYVQHLLAEQQTLVWDVLSRKGRIYICGDGKHMAKDVELALTQIVQTLGGEAYRTTKAAEEYIAKLEKEDRYLKDVWSTH